MVKQGKFLRSGEKHRFSFSVVNNLHTTSLLKRESKRSCYGIYLLLVLIVKAIFIDFTRTLYIFIYIYMYKKNRNITVISSFR